MGSGFAVSVNWSTFSTSVPINQRPLLWLRRYARFRIPSGILRATSNRAQSAPGNRLNDDQRIEVARRYGAGDTTTQLAKDYGVAKSTIIGILREKSVVVRRQPLTSGQVSEAARLYVSGRSLSQVAKQLNVNQETMRVAILRAGVFLREPAKAKSA